MNNIDIQKEKPRSISSSTYNLKDILSFVFSIHHSHHHYEHPAH